MGGTHRHKRLTTHSTTKEGVGEAGGGGDRAAASSCESGSGGRRRGRRLRGQLHGREPAARAMAPARAAGARAARARAATTAAAPPEGGGDDDGAAWRPCAAGSGCTKARDEHGRQYMRKAVCKRWRAFGSRVMRTHTSRRSRHKRCYQDTTRRAQTRIETIGSGPPAGCFRRTKPASGFSKRAASAIGHEAQGGGGGGGEVARVARVCGQWQVCEDRAGRCAATS